MLGAEEDEEEMEEEEEGEDDERLVLRRFLVTERARGCLASLSQARAVRASRQRRNSRAESG